MMVTVRKIALIGNHGVGKTSLISRYVDDQFSDRYLTTIGVKISKKDLSLVDGRTLRLMIWDTEGGVRLTVFPKSYISGSACGIFVLDGSRPESWAGFRTLVDEFKTLNPVSECYLAINKVDLLNEPSASEVLARVKQEFGGEFGWIELTSAKTGQNVSELFQRYAEFAAMGPSVDLT